MRLMGSVHESNLSQRLGGEFKFLKVVESKIRSRGSKIETLVADLHDAQNVVYFVEHRGRHQFMNCRRAKLIAIPTRLDALKNAGVLAPGKVVE